MFVAQTIAELARKQCEIQYDDSAKRVQGMINALNMAQKSYGFDLDEEMFLYWIKFIKNGEVQGYRNVPVRVGGNTIPFNGIDRHMKFLIEAINEGRLNAYHAYKEFEEIHPFVDGNGRVGHVLWAFMVHRYSGVFPMTLPPNVFNIPGYE